MASKAKGKTNGDAGGKPAGEGPLGSQEKWALWWVATYGTLRRIASEVENAGARSSGKEADELRLAAGGLDEAIEHLAPVCPDLAVRSPPPELAKE
jgi:hypothetical protein